MYPKSSFDKVQCLETLVGIRTDCTVEQEYPYFIEDVEGIDVPDLATLARGSDLNGVGMARRMINSAARLMLGDIELLMNNGFALKNTAGDMCSSCNLLPTYTANTGIIVKSIVASRYQQLQITRLTVLTNVTGLRTLRIDDGFNPKNYPVNLVSGVLMPLDLNYITDQKSVKIFFTDNTVGLGQVSCATVNSCGCGGSTTAHNPIAFTGLLAGNEVTTQYGFLACAAVVCSYDALMCNLIKQTPNIFGLALVYKIGEKYLLEKAASTRNNAKASFNEEEKSELVKNFGGLYASMMYGKNDRKSVKNIINSYLVSNKDSCVTCTAKVMKGAITG